MPDKKPPHFKTEAEEAAWWARNQNFVLQNFRQAKAENRLGTGTVARLARERAAKPGSSPTITIRLPEADLTRARDLAAQNGLRYQTYLRMLIHQALDAAERKATRR